MLARRRKLPPLTEPRYDFEAVPHASVKGSNAVIVPVTSRQQWLNSLSEMVLLCNEASLRLAARTGCGLDKGGAKPLSLEYIADRLDSDDPLRGYMVRTRSEGWLQGFVTITQFTIFQRWFQWDSLIEQAGLRKDEQKGRVTDRDGALARELAGQLHEGNPGGEGVVWPRIAEVSLLGGLGCGSCLMRLILAELENEESQYEWVVLQATKHSIPFYESCGFVRVGAVAIYEPDSEQSNADASASSGTKLYTVRNSGLQETPRSVAKKLEVQEFDIVFLNRRMFPGLDWNSKLRTGTKLQVPSGCTKAEPVLESVSPSPFKQPWYRRRAPHPDPGPLSRYLTAYYCKSLWEIISNPKPGVRALDGERRYRAIEDETPAAIAKRLEIDVAMLIEMNRNRYSDLLRASRLRAGTKLRLPVDFKNKRVSRVEEGAAHDVVAYRHWTDQRESVRSVLDTPPSYMMAKRLDKQRRTETTPAVVDLRRAIVKTAPTVKSTRNEAAAAITSPVAAGPRVDVPPAELLRSASSRILTDMCMVMEGDRNRSELFMELPKKKEYPDYFRLIEEPISIRMIRQRIGQGDYITMKAFTDDIYRPGSAGAFKRP
jgi:hypothetical protein